MFNTLHPPLYTGAELYALHLMHVHQGYGIFLVKLVSLIRLMHQIRPKKSAPGRDNFN
jgi:hypothetical protein